MIKEPNIREGFKKNKGKDDCLLLNLSEHGTAKV